MKKRSGCSWIFFMVLSTALVLLGFSMAKGRLPQLSGMLTQPGLTTVETTAPPALQPPEFAKAGRYRYHYHQLEEAQQKAYRDIYSQLPGFPESVAVEGITTQQLNAVFSALLFDQPLLFQISSTNYKTRSVDGKLAAFIPEYRMDREKYQRRCETLLRAVQALTAPAGGSQFDIELALHDQLVRMCSYSEAAEDAEKSTAYGALVENSASCEGYAKAMQLLLELYDIDSYIVTGNASNAAGFSGGHAWNKVRIEGDWYYLDATWNDPVVEDGKKSNISHAYFNLSEADLSKTHEITTEKDKCTAISQNYFVKKGLEFSKIDRGAEALLSQALAAALDAGDNVLELRLTSSRAMSDAVDYLFQRQRIFRVLTNADLGGTRLKTDTVYRSELPQLRVIRIMPVLK